ncbi:hypothetical protein GWI33_003874 [Rhynchophorus ferrugineus]|uniref:Uncharacterized protein n=1 Tax=Rhynchophorus ferrugineus TaxID=354439 RepID=A0A834ITD6_RHYFE|nr:hypothetical protein GWI33_003874 [Rhynchophorus ferrugineus]
MPGCPPQKSALRFGAIGIYVLAAKRDDSDAELRGFDLREILRPLEGGALLGGVLMEGDGFNLTIGLVGRSDGMEEGVGKMFWKEEAEKRRKEVRGIFKEGELE